MKLSVIFDLDVININTARLLGKINGVFIHKETFKICYLACRKNEIQLAIPLESVKLTPQSVVASETLICDSNFLADHLFLSNMLPSFDKLGVRLGNLIDLNISAKTKTFSIDKAIFPLKKIITCGEIIVVDVESYRLGINTRAIRKDKDNDVAVKIISEEPTDIVVDIITQPTTPVVTPSNALQDSTVVNDIPKIGHLTNMWQSSENFDTETLDKFSRKIVFVTPKPLNSLTMNYSYLLGKTLYRDICDITRQILFAKGTIISTETVSDAIRYGKLAELSLSASRYNSYL